MYHLVVCSIARSFSHSFTLIIFLLQQYTSRTYTIILGLVSTLKDLLAGYPKLGVTSKTGVPLLNPLEFSFMQHCLLCQLSVLLWHSDFLRDVP